LQFAPQKIFAWKHSQYFFKQWLFLQWQPLLCSTSSAFFLESASKLLIFGLKACGLRSNVAWTAARREASLSLLFSHTLQLQPLQ